MRFFGNSIMGLAALAVGVGVMAGNANAQQASFKLPFPAHWGSVVLEPGEYKVRFPSAITSPRVIQVTGEKTTMNFMVPVTAYVQTPFEKGELTLVDVNGSYNVRSISDTWGNRIFSFRLPKNTESSTSALKHPNPARIAVNIKAPAR